MRREKKSLKDKVSFFDDSDIIDVFEDAGGSSLEGIIFARLDNEEEKLEKLRKKYKEY